MATVTVSRASVTQEQVGAVLRDRLPGSVKVEAEGSNTLKVKKNVFSHAKVRIESGGAGTTLRISPYAVGPLGWAITTMGLSKQIASVLEQSSELE